MFMKPTKCYVQPKFPKVNQHNKVYISDFPLGKEILIKSDKFDQYFITQELFIKEWSIISYYGNTKFKRNIQTKFNGKPAIYENKESKN